MGPNFAAKKTTSEHTYKCYLKQKKKCKLIFLEPVTESEIEKEIKQLNANKSSCHDDIAPKVVKKWVNTL